jgi:putative tryptophan/tyrosine transport system substrate-binding protein
MHIPLLIPYLRKLLSNALVMALLGMMPNFAFAYTGVTLVMSSPTAVNLEFVEAMKEEFAASKTPLKIKVIDLQETGQLQVAENGELVVALGVKALEASSKLKLSTPVIGVFTPLPVYNKLLVQSKREVSTFSAVVLEQPYTRQFNLIKTILPEATSVGVILGSTSSQYADQVKEDAEKKAINLHIESVSQTRDLMDKLKSILYKYDTLLAIPDPEVYNRETVQPILLTSYRHQKPVFGFSKAYVQAGALAAVYSTTKQLAKQVAEIAIEAQSVRATLPFPQAPKYFSVAINNQVARSLNIKLDDEDLIHSKLLQLEVTD